MKIKLGLGHDTVSPPLAHFDGMIGRSLFITWDYYLLQKIVLLPPYYLG